MIENDACVISGSPKPRVLVLSRAYPSPAIELLGLWVRQLVHASTGICDPTVIAPIPWSPPLPRLPDRFARFRHVPQRRNDHGIDVYHPHFLVGPGSTFARYEPGAYRASVRRLVQRLHAQRPFDLVHAHFTWPDGVVGAWIAESLGVPLVITEQAPWRPWLETATRTRREAVWAARRAAAHIAISNSVRDSINYFTGDAGNLYVIPDAVDGTRFVLPTPESLRRENELLFVGVIRYVKGVDLLIRALRLLRDRGHRVSLSLIGESYYRAYQKDEAALHELVDELAVGDNIQFRGKQPLGELVRAMQQCTMLVLPSRAESLGMVLVEALACGTPVVATRCGGPEDIVTADVGELVAPGDPAALADGIERVLKERARFDPHVLRAHALERFGVETVVSKVAETYARVLER